MQEIAMQRHHVRLWCLCPGAVGWGEFHEAESPSEAVARALDGTSTCCRCYEVFASCGPVCDVRRDEEVTR